MNREQWLTDLAKYMERLFNERRYLIRVPYKVTCGWPCRKGLAAKSRTIGECHSYKSSKGGNFEVFISPMLEKPIEVAGTLMHELIHVTVGTECGHKGQFVRACKSLGMAGKPREAKPGKILEGRILPFVERLGAYPHSALLPITTKVKPSYTVKLVCECGCNFRISPKWLDEAGVPVCGCGLTMAVEDA